MFFEDIWNWIRFVLCASHQEYSRGWTVWPRNGVSVLCLVVSIFLCYRRASKFLPYQNFLIWCAIICIFISSDTTWITLLHFTCRKVFIWGNRYLNPQSYFNLGFVHIAICFSFCHAYTNYVCIHSCKPFRTSILPSMPPSFLVCNQNGANCEGHKEEARGAGQIMQCINKAVMESKWDTWGPPWCKFLLLYCWTLPW